MKLPPEIKARLHTRLARHWLEPDLPSTRSSIVWTITDEIGDCYINMVEDPRGRLRCVVVNNDFQFSLDPSDYSKRPILH